MKALLLGTLVCHLLGAGELSTTSDLSGPHIVYRCLIGEVGKLEFEKMASEFLRPEEITVGVLAVYGSKWERIVAGPRGDEWGSYDDTRSLRDRYNVERSGCPEVQQAVKFGSGIILRSLDRGCRNEERPLLGKANALEVVVGRDRVELLEFSFSHPMGEGNEHNVHASFFVRTNGALTAENAKAVTARFSAITGIRNLFVWLRADTWFFNFGDFPALFPWQGRPKLPSVEQFLRTREVRCSMFDGGPISCREHYGAALKGVRRPSGP